MTSLEEIKRLLSAATPRPWEVGATVVFADAAVDYDNENGSGEIAKMEWRCQEMEANAQLIAKAPTLLAELIEQVERLEAAGRKALKFVEAIETGGRDEGDNYAASDVAKTLRQALEESK